MSSKEYNILYRYLYNILMYIVRFGRIIAVPYLKFNKFVENLYITYCIF